MADMADMVDHAALRSIWNDLDMLSRVAPPHLFGPGET